MDVISESDDDHPVSHGDRAGPHVPQLELTETPTSKKRERRPTVKIHPDDCAALGLADGDPCASATGAAKSVSPRRSSTRLQRGVIVSESVWPGSASAVAPDQHADQPRSGSA